MLDLVERAKDLAHRAHAGQVDKAGRPYIEHVARVAAAVSDNPKAEAVAWLHDVLEDCPAFEEEFWRNHPAWLIEAVDKLTRWPWMSQSYYYLGVRSNPLALRVKLADIADNADEERLALLDEKTAARLRRKYAKARKMLEVG
jgi:(p)ppGpp synthase/HD superfamily hydrolase